jgi:hypothetical protein
VVRRLPKPRIAKLGVRVLLTVAEIRKLQELAAADFRSVG